MADKQFTYSDVAEHNLRNDLYVVIHDKVYDSTMFVDEHGGEEVLLEVAGQDATEAFEDVGHSDEARETLEKLLVGKLERKEGDPKPKAAAPRSVSAGPSATSSGGAGIGLYVVIVIGGALAYYAYQYMNANKEKI